MKQIFLIASICTLTAFSTIAQINVQDSLALVALYNSTDGENWLDNTNWLTAAPVSEWNGVTTKDTRVITLTLTFNIWSGTIPSELGNLTYLQSLELTGDRLTGTIPSELGNLTNLQSLHLELNKLSGNIPSELGNLTNLQSLNLDFNKLSGSIPSELGNLTNLQSLELTGDTLTGTIPSELSKLAKLQFLYLDFNQLSGNIPFELGKLKRLESLGLSYNDLTGSIPSELANLTNLQILYLNNNRLSGSILSELGNLKNVGYLYLNNNQLTGSIPHNLGNLSLLRGLDLSYNNLSGNIPSELGNFDELTELDLSYNNLSGNIPSELGQLNSLEQLDLNNNNLSDTIPTSLLSLIKPVGNFYTLNVMENQFTFTGMQPFVEISNPQSGIAFAFNYAPQATIGLHNNGGILSVSAGGELSDNVYRWYKNGELYKKFKGDSTLKITKAGEYFVRVKNAIARDLTLQSDTININILPVSLLSFTAQKQKNTTLLQWQTTNEINNSYFNIERSSNTGNFTTIGKVDALNALNTNNYSFTDDLPLEGFNYYRLKQVDKDGMFTYSKIVSADFSGYSSAFSISPNPASGEVKITIPKTNSASQIIIYNLAGKKMFSKQIAANTTSTQVNISSLPIGAYNIVLLQNGEQQNLKLIKNNY